MTDHQFVDPMKKLTRKPASDGADTTPAHDQGLVHLQQLVGNRGVQRLLADRGSGEARRSTFIQAKLTVGAADDAYEAEADNVAQKVMAMRDVDVQREAEEDEVMAKRADVQREAEEDEVMAKRVDIQREAEEDEVMAKRADVQREAEEDELMAKRVDIQREAEEDEVMAKRVDIQREAEEDELMAKRADVQREAEEDEVMAKRVDIQRAAEVDMMDSFDVSTDVEDQINSQKGGGEPLPDSAREFFEPRFGNDFSDVRVHANSNADSLNRSISARAFTTGNDIFFRSGEYNPDNSSGRELLAHELTHVVQQTGGKAQPKRVNETK